MSDSSHTSVDMLRANRWRSEALTALTACEEFKKSQKAMIRKIEDDVWATLVNWIDKSLLQACWPNFEQTILQLAVQLHQTLRCSSKSYSLYFPNVHEGFASHAITDFEYKRLETWHSLEPRDVGSLIQLLSPGLIRLERMDAERVTLAKPVVVAYRRLPTGNSSPGRPEHMRGESQSSYSAHPKVTQKPESAKSSKTAWFRSASRGKSKGPEVELAAGERNSQSHRSSASLQSSPSVRRVPHGLSRRRSPASPHQRHRHERGEALGSISEQQRSLTIQADPEANVVIAQPTGTWQQASTTAAHFNTSGYIQTPRRNGTG